MGLGMDVETRKMFCGVVTLYNPPENYLLNIASYSGFLDKLFVVDNSPTENSVDSDALLERFANAVILSRGKNTGVAHALNLGIEAAGKNGSDWLLTMDQDSYFCAVQGERFFRSVNMVEKSRVAIISPLHRPARLDYGDCVFEEKTVVWTSGNLLNLELVRKVGLFDEKLFIDSVDHDYCFRVNLSGFKVLQATNCYLIHCIGDRTKGTALVGKKQKSYMEHSPKRMYFIVRNGLYLASRYRGDFPVFIAGLFANIRKDFFRALKYSNARADYVRYAGKAVFDYYKGVFGNAVDI